MKRASRSSCFLGSIDGCVPGATTFDAATVGGAGGCWRLSIAANITEDNINRLFELVAGPDVLAGGS